MHRQEHCTAPRAVAGRDESPRCRACKSGHPTGDDFRARGEGTAFKEEINAAKVTEYLGVPRFRPTLAEEKNEIGVATGLPVRIVA